MEDTKKASMLAEMKSKIEAAVVEGSKAITAGKLPALYAAEETLGKLEKEYEGLVLSQLYEELLAKDEPIVEAIKMYSYKTLRHRDKKDGETKKVVGLEVVEKERQIDLLKFCEYSQRFGAKALPTSWKYKASKLNQLMCLRAALELKFTKTELAALTKSYYLEEEARKVNLGETPTSNTQICKALQTVIDAIIFKDDGKGGNAYKCNSHDVAYMLGTYTKKGRKALSLAVSKDGFFRLVITEICLRILENGRYTLEGYKVVKDKA